jgi:hypothetical protein
MRTTEKAGTRVGEIGSKTWLGMSLTDVRCAPLRRAMWSGGAAGEAFMRRRVVVQAADVDVGIMGVDLGRSTVTDGIERVVCSLCFVFCRRRGERARPKRQARRHISPIQAKLARAQTSRL